jgi:hypothetical protein
MNGLNKILALLLLPAILVASAQRAPAQIAAAQAASSQSACSDWKNGVFHVYLKHEGGTHYVVYRDGDNETEINLNKGDSTVWKVKWLDDCTYSVHYLSGNTPIPRHVADHLQHHDLIYKMKKATPDYYTYSEYWDNARGLSLESDTVWLSEKASSAYNPYVRAAGGDTSGCAVLYLYRPKKVALSLSAMPLYLNDINLCSMKNGGHFIFLVPRAGTYTLSAKLLGTEQSLPLQIEPGKKYFIQCTMNWGVYSAGLRNYKLVLQQVPEDQGNTEFHAN